MSVLKTRPAWLMLAIASGSCAAINGVFAKLYCLSHPVYIKLLTNYSTTTELTTSWASSLAGVFGLDPSNTLVEYAIRGVRPPPHYHLQTTAYLTNPHLQLFFALNLAFNAVMWGLFTRALTLASSTVRVSIINTSANFIVTAVLGALIFNEKLPGMWWLGAAMLVTGSVIIGMREDTETKAPDNATLGSAAVLDRDAGTSTSEATSRDADENASLQGIRKRERDNSVQDGVLK
jgi:drug/metabolite transporter (DMT)-like permease